MVGAKRIGIILKAKGVFLRALEGMAKDVLVTQDGEKDGNDDASNRNSENEQRSASQAFSEDSHKKEKTQKEESRPGKEERGVK